jgi:probable HAF family extracellular repeat protein
LEGFIMTRLLCGLVALGLLVGAVGKAMGQPSYVYTTFDVPGSSVPSGYTEAKGINASGQIVGWYFGWYLDPAGSHGFLLDNGSYTTLDVPGSISTTIEEDLPFPQIGINNWGQIVGSYADAQNKSHGFLLDQCNYTTLDAPGSISTQACGINDSGQIVGDYFDGMPTHGCCSFDTGTGFVLENGTYTTLDAPAFDNSANGVNDSGQIVGYTGDHGFLYDNGSYTTLEVPGSIDAYVNGINASGQIVGYYNDPT